MKKKLNTSLHIAKSDGQPSVLPPLSVGWCYSNYTPAPRKCDGSVKCTEGATAGLQINMSTDCSSRGQSGAETEDRSNLEGTSNDDDYANDASIENSHMHEDNSTEPGEAQRHVSSPVNTPQSLPLMMNPNMAMSEDSNVDVESEDQGIPNDSDIKTRDLVSNEKLGREGNGSLSHVQEVSAMSDAHYIEKQVVESFLGANSNDLSNSRGYHDRHQASDKRPAANGNNNYEKALTTSTSNVTASNNAINSKSTKSLDAILLTIASVAAGEGEPPEFLTRHQEKAREERSPYQSTQNTPHFNKNKKIRSDKIMSASARLPVISSLLAPSNSGSHNSLPGIQHIASSGRTSSSPTTVLPSVAHFLGPAKSPPLGYTSHHSTNEMYGSSLSSAGNETPGHQSGQYQVSSSGHSPNISVPTKSKNNRKPVTPAGLRLSLAASEELPDPLPLPQYSEKVIRAKQLGTVAFDRPTVLRETVQFFLQFKHYWSSHDYDRISNLVIELFPEFKDNSDTPGVPANKRIRTDLSMYARNFRRREVSQRKKEGNTSLGHLDQKQDSSVSPHSETPNKTYAHSGSPNAPGSNSGPNNTNPSDFCNELLTAASIIESQNTSVRNCEFASPVSQSQHKVKVSDSHVIHKQEVIEEEEGNNAGLASNHHHHPHHQHQQQQQDEQVNDEDDDTPIHFVYDKDSMVASSRDSSNPWQMYSDQMAQALAAENSRLDYGLTSDQAVKKDLGTCARNMRRRLPASKYKPSSSQKAWNNSSAGLEGQSSEMNSQASLVQGTTEYMKALMAAQNMNLTELGMTQRNLGELAMLAGIKQRIEQHPQDVTDLERQYLAQCSSDEQRQALMASGAFGNDTVAMAALSAFYGQLGMDISVGTKRSLSSEYSTSSAHDGSSNVGAGELLEVPNKRQRRISQAEVEKRLREAELSHGISHENKTHALSVGISEKNLVKREPMSPNNEGLKTASSTRQQHQNPLNMPVFPSSSSASAHEQAAYWDANMALIGAASMAHSSARQIAAQAHSQAEIHHLSGHDHSSSLTASEGPMNLTYHESDKHNSQRHHMASDSPLHDSLPDTAGLAAQVEVTTSSVKSHSPRRRASSSPRSSQQGDQSNSRDQVRTEVWFPHGAGFKKENQEIVCLPDPLPIPTYSQKIVSARDDGLSMRHRSEIIRETARFFLNLKYWWSSADYTRISELVVQQFPDLKDDITADGMTNYRRIQRDLSMCARNLRRSKKPRKMREISSDGSSSLLDIPETPRPSKKSSKSNKPSSLFSSSVDKKMKRQSGMGSKLKKIKQDTSAAAVSETSVSGGLNEDMTAAAALLQQQFMQSSSSAYHPSAHLLPSSHLLPSLQTHPALHEQQMQVQLNSAMLQQQQQQQQQQHHHHHHHQQEVSVEEAHNAKRLVKEESQEAVEQQMSSIKTSAVTPIQRSVTPPSDNQPNLTEVAKQMNKSNHGLGRSMDTPTLSKDEHEKLLQAQAPVTNSMKVYVDPDHGNDLQERFSTLWRKGKFFDASLGVANKKLHVHKLVLLAMSPYLQETFKNADPRSQLEVNLPSDTTYETAKAFLKYIYEGVLEVDTSSVRSLHKIATMLQMTKLAQYCQNFAQQLQEEADQANGAVESEIPKISVNLGELAEIQAQRQRLMEAQALQRLGESNELHRASSTRYISEDRSQLKSDYLQTSSEQTASDQAGSNSHFIHPDILAQHRALVAASSSIQSTTPSLLLSSSQDVTTQQLIQAALARHQVASPPPPSSASSSSMYHQYQQQVVADSNSALLHRLSAPESAVSVSAATSLDPHQQRLALAAYWQAHNTLELMSRNQLTGLTSDPSNLTSASELAAIAASTSQDSRHVLSNLGHEVKMKSSSGHSRGHHSKEAWNSQSNDSDSGHQATMLPETCLPGDMTRAHHGEDNT